MDLNPEKFLAPFDAYELAAFAQLEQVDVVICAMAWLDSDPARDGMRDDDDSWSAARSTLGYWAARLDPLVGSGVAFVACNRVGREEGECEELKSAPMRQRKLIVYGCCRRRFYRDKLCDAARRYARDHGLCR